MTEIDDMNLEWYAVPMMSRLVLEIGGLEFPAAPFNGWFASVEISSRDLTDDGRYGLLKDLGDAMKLDTTNNSSLWKDRVGLELNAAVLYSFQRVGASIVDQHTVSEQFLIHLRNEYRERGGCPADWVWISPSQSGSLTPVYHQEMLHYHLSPSFEKQDNLWQTYRFPEDGAAKQFRLRSIGIALRFSVCFYRAVLKRRPLVKIIFSTGKKPMETVRTS